MCMYAKFILHHELTGRPDLARGIFALGRPTLWPRPAQLVATQWPPCGKGCLARISIHLAQPRPALLLHAQVPPRCGCCHAAYLDWTSAAGLQCPTCWWYTTSKAVPAQKLVLQDLGASTQAIHDHDICKGCRRGRLHNAAALQQWHRTRRTAHGDCADGSRPLRP